MSRLEQLQVECPACKAVGGAPAMLEDWDGRTYRWTCCGGRAHLNPDAGGARTWLPDRSKRKAAG